MTMWCTYCDRSHAVQSMVACSEPPIQTGLYRLGRGLLFCKSFRFPMIAASVAGPTNCLGSTIDDTSRIARGCTYMTDKKGNVLRTATRLFARNGYHAVGVDRIIDESGVAKMTFYKYFPSKKDLIVAVLNERAADASASLETFVQRKRSPQAKLKAVFDWHTEWFNSNDFTGCMFIAATAEYHDTDAEVLRSATSQKQSLIQFICGIACALMTPNAAERFAHRCVMLLDGAIISALAQQRYSAADEAWTVARCLLDAEQRRT